MKPSLPKVLLWLSIGSGLASCAPAGEVTRVMDGRVIVGRVIEPVAYASFLRGALAEEKGELPLALEAYTQASSQDDDDVEIWSRIGDVRCRLSASDPGADAAFARALKIDDAYGPALEARARCESSRGQEQASHEDSEQASLAEPLELGPQVALAVTDADRPGVVASRERLIALTLLHGTSASAWGALAAWASVHHDPMLVARALGEESYVAPGRKWELAGRAVALAGDGDLAAARLLAAMLVDAPGDRSSGGQGPAPASNPLLARLAVDEALGRGDLGAARRRAVSAHLGLDLVAGRALLLGKPDLARDLVEPVVLADPGATGARMILAVVASRLGDAGRFARALSGSAGELSPRADAGDAKIVAEALLPFTKLVERETSPEIARAWLEGWQSADLLPGDALVTSLAVDLAALGVLRDADLPLDAKIELLARRSEALPNIQPGAVDARHLLFAWALERPLERETLELARRVGLASTEDPLIAVALARLSLAQGRELKSTALDHILALDPSDPILAAAALDLAKRSGDTQAIAPARARLTALARTPRERARALE
jgi:hypothetical protein